LKSSALDILVNNAGYTDCSGLRHDQGSFKRMRSIIELTSWPPSTAAASLAADARPGTGGVMINISSIRTRRQSSGCQLSRGAGALSRYPCLALEYARASA
jgi:short-subunit dehydrogenase